MVINDGLVSTYILCTHDIHNIFLIFLCFYAMWFVCEFSSNYAEQKISQYIYWEKSMYKWSNAVQTHVIRESTVCVCVKQPQTLQKREKENFFPELFQNKMQMSCLFTLHASDLECWRLKETPCWQSNSHWNIDPEVGLLLHSGNREVYVLWLHNPQNYPQNSSSYLSGFDGKWTSAVAITWEGYHDWNLRHLN